MTSERDIATSLEHGETLAQYGRRLARERARRQTWRGIRTALRRMWSRERHETREER